MSYINRTTWAALVASMWLVALHVPTAHAFVFTVGKSGTGNNCSFPTVQQAINAARDNKEADEIWITRDVVGGYYQNQALRIEDQPDPLTIVGGFDDCRDVTRSGVTELHGNGGPRAPVLDIRGGSVTIQGLRITRGDADSTQLQDGGGIRYAGIGVLSVLDSLIDRNNAGRGAGIAITSVGQGGASIRLENTEVSDNRALSVGGGILLNSQDSTSSAILAAQVRINRNYAVSGGGGFAMTGQSSLFANSLDLQIEANGTLGNGGAVLAVSPVEIQIGGSPFVGALGTFVGNEATNGGAIALASHPDLGSPAGRSIVQLSSPIQSPQVFTGNRAHGRGGALWIDRQGAPSPANNVSKICTWNVGFEGNDARDGGSAVALTGQGAVYQNHRDCSQTQAYCANLSCNRFSGNVATEDNGQPSAQGSLFDVRDSADFQLTGARVVQNTLPWLFRMAHSSVSEPAPTIGVDTAFIYANTVATLLVQCTACSFEATSSTIVANVIADAVLINSPRNFILRESIIDQPGRVLFATNPDPTQSTLDHVLYTSNYSSSIPTVRFGDPGFMNAANGDYRLAVTSTAMDVLPERTGFDFIGRPRTIDVPWHPNGLGARDLGAVETQLYELSEEIFGNGFD